MRRTVAVFLALLGLTASAQTVKDVRSVLETSLKAMGGALEVQAKMIGSNVTSITLRDTGHWLMEQRPAEIKTELRKFFVH